MAKRGNGLTPEQLVVLGTIIERDEDEQAEQMRRHVRAVFDQAMRDRESFDDVLVAVFAAGIQAALAAQPKRKRRSRVAKAAMPEAEVRDNT